MIKNFEDHVILYAKGWYGRSDRGIIPDLSDLLSWYSGTLIADISKNDVMEFLISTFVRTTKPYHMIEAIKEILIPRFADTQLNRSPECILIGKISIWAPDETWKLSLEDLKNKKDFLPILFKPKQKEENKEEDKND